MLSLGAQYSLISAGKTIKGAHVSTTKTIAIVV